MTGEINYTSALLEAAGGGEATDDNEALIMLAAVAYSQARDLHMEETALGITTTQTRKGDYI